MKTLKIKTKNPYGVIVDYGASEILGCAIKGAKKVLIVSDETVMPLYGEKIKKDIERYCDNVYTFILKSGEKCKTQTSVQEMLTLIAELNFLKTDCLVAFGGGTVLDVTGFVASVFKRGIPYVNVPTTLLSMADACIGGKTAIDFLSYKNIIGSFYQPKAVFCDTKFLSSLKEEDYKDGLVEIIKCGIIGDKKLLKDVENKKPIDELIYKALKLKAKLIEQDELDNDKRQLLNFGHTFAHAVESYSGFTVSHGKAVAFGMVKETIIYDKLYNKKQALKLMDILNRENIQWKFDFDKDKLLEFISCDKKREKDQISMIFPKSIGKCKIVKVKMPKLKEALFEITGNPV